MTCLVTGSTGFVGSAVVRRLLSSGRPVRALVRETSNLANLEGLDLEYHLGDMRDPQSLERACQGCSSVFHLAADYRLWARHQRSMFETNVRGTVSLMGAAQRAGVERIVYTSSVATLGIPEDGRPGDEQTPVSMKQMIGPYKRSKFLAEEEVRRMAREESLPVVIVNPSAPIGPRDLRPTPTGRLVLDAARGRIPAYVDTGLNVVHVDDVAAGHLLALEQGVVGERYILGGENLTLREILCALAHISGRAAPRVKLPRQALYPLALASEIWARVTNGGEPRVSVDALRMSKKRMFFSSEKAQAQLGYHARPARQALEDAVAWFRAHNYCGST